jgi:hypothetical protein
VHRGVFLLSAVILSGVWVLAAALSLVRLSGWAGLALSIGVATGIATDRALAGWTNAHIPVAVVVGTAVVVGVLVTALERELRSRAVPTSAHVRLPSRPYLVLEGVPYLVYGTLAVVMFVSVHLIGWTHVRGIRFGLTTLELGLFLPLFPAVIASGHAERSLREFWRRASELQTRPVADRSEFGQRLVEFYRQALRRWTRNLLLASMLSTLLVEALLRTRVLAEIAPYQSDAVLRLLYVLGLIGYGFLAWGQFASMFCLSLVQPDGPVRAVLAGAVTTCVAGVLLTAALGYVAVALALVLGAAVYVVVATQAVLRLLRRGDQSYASAL